MTPENRHEARERQAAVWYRIRALRKEEKDLKEQLTAEEPDSEQTRLLQARLNRLQGEIQTARQAAADCKYDTPEGEATAPRNKR